MKGTSKKKVTKKKSGSGKSSKNAKRAVLHSGNHAWNLAKKTRSKLKRIADGLPGTPRGKHIPKSPDCRCGKCNIIGE